MKRIVAFLVVLIMILSSTTACNKTDDAENSQTNESPQSDANSQNDENKPTTPSVGEPQRIFSDYLDSIGFEEGLSQSELMSKVEGYAYNGTYAMDLVVGMHYDGELGGGWEATGERFSFSNDYQEYENGSVNYSNSLYTKVQLDGLELPNGITFNDTVEQALHKCEIEMNPETDYVRDSEDTGEMTLYRDEDTVIKLISGEWLIVIPEDPNPNSYVLKYESTVPSTIRNGTVTRSVSMTFNSDKKLGSIGISIQENYIIKPIKELLKKGDVKSISVTSLPEGYEYAVDGEYVEPIVNYFANLNLTTDFEENPDEYVGMTWVFTLNYKNGDSLTVYHFGRFLRVEQGPWYKLTYEESHEFDEIIFRLQNEINSNIQSDESREESSEDYFVNDENSSSVSDEAEKLPNDRKSVFVTDNVEKITFYGYYGYSEGSVVPDENMPEIKKWLGTFKLGETAAEPLPPGTNTYFVKIEYTDGAVVWNGLDTIESDGMLYYLTCDTEPDCFSDMKYTINFSQDQK